jgi:hypothetical protein
MWKSVSPSFTVEYDGERFVVRDNFVGALACPGPALLSGEWAYVVLSHDLATGRAELLSSAGDAEPTAGAYTRPLLTST